MNFLLKFHLLVDSQELLYCFKVLLIKFFDRSTALA